MPDSGRASALAAARDASTLDAIAGAARAGDPLARDLVARAAAYLGRATAHAIDNGDPERVVLSGPMVQAGADLFDDVPAAERRSVLDTGHAGVPVVRAALGADAKAIGAATLVTAAYLGVPAITSW